MANIFNSAPVKVPNNMRNHLTPVNTMSFNFGGIYPIFCKTVLPGDRWSMALQSFVRTVPLLSPVMSRNDLKVDAFFVPFRLIWKSAPDWHQMLDESLRRPQLKIDSSYDPTIIEDCYNLFFGESSLNDYFGFASIPAAKLTAKSIPLYRRTVCALPWRAYRFIYDYYFRNKAIEKEITEFSGFEDFYGDNDNVITEDNAADFFQSQVYNPDWDELKVFYRPWRRDIFTAALPDPQNGADVLISQGDLDVVSDGSLKVNLQEGVTPQTTDYLGIGTSSANDTILLRDADKSSKGQLTYKDGIKVVLDPSSAPTIRKLRFASYLEEFEEAQARGGSNKGFKEWLRNIWAVKSSDARLDRPEYLGGYRGPIQISEVPQTSQGTESSPQGTLAGKGLSIGGKRLFKKMFFEEPGIVMVLMSIVPKSSYCQGDPREWLYESPFDFPNPYFDHLGEQDVKEAELNALAAFDDEAPKTFGYNIRNYEMKSYPDEIHGALRSSLSYWHEGRIFDWDNYPGLNVDFLKVFPGDVNRIFPSTESSDKLIGQFFFDIRHKRRLSLFGIAKFG